MPGSDEGIKLGLSYGKVLGAIVKNSYEVTIGLDVGTDLGSLDRSIGGYNGGKIEVLLLGDSLVYIDGKVHVSD